MLWVHSFPCEGGTPFALSHTAIWLIPIPSVAHCLICALTALRGLCSLPPCCPWEALFPIPKWTPFALLLTAPSIPHVDV